MGKSLIVVHSRFDLVWPFAADHLHTLWEADGDVEFHRLENTNDQLLGQIANDTDNIVLWTERPDENGEKEDVLAKSD